MKRKPKTNLSLSQVFKQYCLSNLPVNCSKTMINARGNADAKSIMLTPALSPEEYENDLPFSDSPARIFHNLLLQELNISTEEFFVAAYHNYSTEDRNGDLKVPKSATDAPSAFVREAASLGLINGVVTVGGDAFKYAFGRGRKASMQALAGNVLFDDSINNLPVFVFPDVAGLQPEFSGDYQTDKTKKIWQEETVREIKKTITKFKKENKVYNFV